MRDLLGRDLSKGDYVAFDHFGSFDFGVITQNCTDTVVVQYFNSKLKTQPEQVIKIEQRLVNWWLLNDHSPDDHPIHKDMFYQTLKVNDQVLVIDRIVPETLETIIKFGTIIKSGKSRLYKIKVGEQDIILYTGREIIKIDNPS